MVPSQISDTRAIDRSLPIRRMYSKAIVTPLLTKTTKFPIAPDGTVTCTCTLVHVLLSL